MDKAVLVGRVNEGSATGTQYLWRIEQEGEYDTYVVTSATVVFGSGPETYIFPSDDEGYITSWEELPGSFKGDLDHERAMIEAGYETVVPEEAI